MCACVLGVVLRLCARVRGGVCACSWFFWRVCQPVVFELHVRRCCDHALQRGVSGARVVDLSSVARGSQLGLRLAAMDAAAGSQAPEVSWKRGRPQHNKVK